MGWTGRAPAPDGTQSAPGACQEKERRHASHVHRSRSGYYRNGYRRFFGSKLCQRVCGTLDVVGLRLPNYF
jgi:hypothetical protein